MPSVAAKSRLKLACFVACAILAAVMLVRGGASSHVIVKGNSQTVIVHEANAGELPADTRKEDPQTEEKKSSAWWEQKKHGWMSVAVYAHFNPQMYHRTLGSLRNRGFKGIIVVGVHEDSPPALYELMKQYNAQPEVIKTVPCSYEKHSACMPGGEVPLAVSRNGIISSWLETRPEIDGYVFVGDFRDVFHQTNLFASIPNPPAKMMAFAEFGPSFPVGNINDWWIQGCFGASAKEEVKGNPVLCSGTIIGQRDEMLRFLSKFGEQAGKLMGKDGPAGCKSIGADQGIYNYMVHAGKLGRVAYHKEQGEEDADFVIYRHGDGLVNTVGMQCAVGNNHSFTGVMKQDSMGWVLNNDGKMSPAIHQMDRCHIQLSNLVNNAWKPDNELHKAGKAGKDQPYFTETRTEAWVLHPILRPENKNAKSLTDLKALG